ncbi:undecaprenyl-diphosphate phosphatase [Egibacter rhizosphaerae]|uniref:Undecaprenyl-diphosphatase n=1 Tax=Egibacter rhizosphaerae TaxID=1670831 RepID=A0A411YC83_9ACTN|nr:undecaprenyl-diphosphate phosphatase [Egibacter rhizosphaerae]QBI18785.1 undecaprenyl-diphosphate phosphatase [Egibacter rhizosphaerae]
MTLWEAIILGAIQGLFMFVPVSSTSHLALAQQWLIDRGSALPPPESPEMILFDLVVHVGTMVSVALVLRRSLGRLLVGASADVGGLLGTREGRRGRYLRLVGMGLLSVATTGAIGVVVLQTGTGVFGAPPIIAGNLALTGAILWWTDTVGPRWRGLDGITPLVAIGIGAAQGIALLPGLSRSGLTIACALLLGLRRRWAAEFSFFVAIPTIVAASGVQALLVAREGEPLLVDAGAFAVGFVIAAAVGAVALWGVLRLLYRARFRVFSIYVWILAVLVASGVVVSTH